MAVCSTGPAHTPGLVHVASQPASPGQLGTHRRPLIYTLITHTRSRVASTHTRVQYQYVPVRGAYTCTARTPTTMEYVHTCTF